MQKMVSAIVIAWVAMVAVNAAAAPIGQVKKTSGEAYLLRAGDRQPLKLGDHIEQSDAIETGSDGSVGITFIDNSMFSAGPGSKVSFDQFQFDSSRFKGSFLANMQRGTMSMVTGDIARTSPEAVRIKTPVAILGVRGTRFAVRVGND